MRKVEVIDCHGRVTRDPTSYGYQYSVDLHVDDLKEMKALMDCIKNKNGKVKVRIEILEVEDQ